MNSPLEQVARGRHLLQSPSEKGGNLAQYPLDRHEGEGPPSPTIHVQGPLRLLPQHLGTRVPVLGTWLPDGYRRIFRSYVFGPLGFWTMAPLRYAAKFDPFLSLDCAATPSTPGTIQGKEGIKFCHLATVFCDGSK